MICEALSIKKYLENDNNIFFIYGSEVILKNDSIKLIYSNLADKGFIDKKTINSKNLKNIENAIIENANGSLFGSKIIIEISHDGGKIPKEIQDIFENSTLNHTNNIKIIINSNIQKITKSVKWVKQADKVSLIVQCNKLKPYEEKIWIKSQLTFMQKNDIQEYSDKISDLFSGNLVAQRNEINILKLIYSKDSNDNKIENDDAEFLPYELEDKIIELNTKYALRILKSIRKNDDHYGPLLVWIMGKIINTSVNAAQSKNIQFELERSGVWKNKVSLYSNFIKNNPQKKLISFQKKIYKLDLSSKGLSGLTKDQFWQELDNMVIELTSH